MYNPETYPWYQCDEEDYDSSASLEEQMVGAHVRITVGSDAGRHARVIGYDPDRLVAPFDVLIDGWPPEHPLQFEKDELEVEA